MSPTYCTLFFHHGKYPTFSSKFRLIFHLQQIRGQFYFKVSFAMSPFFFFVRPRHPLTRLSAGHERSLTQIKFNQEGDLLFSSSKDHIINVWFSHNGERLGTYSGHNGAVWTIDVDCACFLPPYSLQPSPSPTPLVCFSLIDPAAQSRFFVSGSADNEMRLWSVQTGKCLFVWEFPTAVKRVSFSDDDEQVVCITEQRMGHQGAIRIFNINRDGDGTQRAYQPTNQPTSPRPFPPTLP